MQVPSWASIREDEEIILLTHPSRWVLLRDVLVSALLLIMSGWVAIQDPYSISEYEVGPLPGDLAVFFGGIVGVFVILGVEELKRITTVYLVTSRQVYYKKGIYQRERVDPTDLDDIVNQEWDQNVFQRTVGKGDVQLKTAANVDSRDVLTFKSIPNPKETVAKFKHAKDMREKHNVQDRMEYEQEAREQQGEAVGHPQDQSSDQGAPQDSLF